MTIPVEENFSDRREPQNSRFSILANVQVRLAFGRKLRRSPLARRFEMNLRV